MSRYSTGPVVDTKFVLLSNFLFTRYFETIYHIPQILSNVFKVFLDCYIFITATFVFNCYLFLFSNASCFLTPSWWRPISYRNQSIDLRSKSMNWFLYDIGLRHERVKLTLIADVFTDSKIWLISQSYHSYQMCSANVLIYALV